MQTQSLSTALDASKADYQAARRGARFRRHRRGVPLSGAGADYHYRSEADYLYMGEAARDVDRNDMICGSIIDRAVDNKLQGGFTPNPDTGDEQLDAALKARWQEEAQDADACDPSGQHTFHDQERLVMRETMVAGDVFALPQRDGTVQLVEFHRCRSPHRKTKHNSQIVHGVEFENAKRRRLRYWFTREPKSVWELVDKVDLQPIAAYDATGEPQVWHHFYPRRPTQTRGVTAFAPVFDTASYHDDIHFSLLLKQQLSAFFLLIRKRMEGWGAGRPNVKKLGASRENDWIGSRPIEDIGPGTEIALSENEDVTPWSPNMPATEVMQHLRFILQVLGVNFGMPLVMVLLDASETNFSGYRGAVDQARLSFRQHQLQTAERFHRPYWRFKVWHWSQEDAALGRLVADYERRGRDAKVLPYRHKWDLPKWPYLEPGKDATADVIRLANGLASPRLIAAERGLDWHDIARQTVEDRTTLIRLAVEAAGQMNRELGLTGPQQVTWRDLAPLPSAERTSLSLTGAIGEDPTTNRQP